MMWRNYYPARSQRTILFNNSQDSFELKKITEELADKNNQAELYMEYIITEIKYIPVIPMILMVLYGAALIACGSFIFTLICLTLMLILVIYLALATISSNNLLLETDNVDEIIGELQEIIDCLQNDS
ncbi:hypothetical protein DENIS_2955 [Desulfonema ishimotonii]|uniref:Uncharacterized protein n=2 Tax=Desulfonema ishimotonii TaxID=45657 RepID=A0A401FYA8_9BACT|nr:hypothetical protein DENIS_2955 [Desulfonema ishimotonii]